MSDNNDDSDDIDDKIEIMSTEDQKTKAIGDLLHNDSSRAIITLLFNNEMTASQIAQKSGMSLPLVRHHLMKLQNTGLVTISKVVMNEKSHEMKYYALTKVGIIILPSSELSKNAKNSKSLHYVIRRICRFVAVGASAIASWFVTHSMQNMKLGKSILLGRAVQNQSLTKTIPPIHLGQFVVPGEFVWPTIISVSIIITGIIIELQIRKRNSLKKDSHH